MGSGHILVYLFDVLVQIYQAYGYPTREAVQSIVENNLYGLDIDDRAAQLAYFAVMMKARQYDRRFFTRGIQPHVMAIQESNALEAFERLQGQLSMDTLCLETANQLIRTFHDAKEYGSILQVDIPGLESADRLMEQLRTVQGDFELMAWVERAEALLPVLAQQAVMLQQKYDVVVTNPPYMGRGGMSQLLSDFVKDVYPNSKSDLFAVFIERCNQMLTKNGYQAMITQQTWMFINSYAKLREFILCSTVISMAHLGARAFEEIGGEVVQTTSFVLGKRYISAYKGIYSRLVDENTQYSKEASFLAGGHQYTFDQEKYKMISGEPFAYWLNENTLEDFQNSKSIGNEYFSCYGLLTGHDEGYIFAWPEVVFSDIAINCVSVHSFEETCSKYAPLCKGGLFRKWYGNRELVVRYDSQGIEGMAKYPKYASNGQARYFTEGMTWAEVCMGNLSVRYMPQGNIFSLKGPAMFHKDRDMLFRIIGYLNTSVVAYFIGILNPTISCGNGVLNRLPIKGLERIEPHRVQENIELSRIDWDSYETSWDFQRNPLVRYAEPNGFLEFPNWGVNMKLEQGYKYWKAICEHRFQMLKANEEELNRIFIDIYGLQDELTPDVADRDVTVHRVFDTKEDVPESMQGSAYVRTKRDEVVSLISYAVGCMLGRYSLDAPGLILAGQPFSEKFVYASVPLAGTDMAGASIFPADGDCYLRTNEGVVRCTFAPDRDGILPICDDDYFTDDIVGRFVRFIEVVYGKDTLEENLKFIADALGGPSRAGSKGTPRQVIRSYFLSDFYADHCKTYQKRPIYWLFDSGKKNGFKCLIYMHRYAPDTIARIRTDYVHEQQSRYRTAIADLENRVASASTAERVKLQKQLAKLRDQAEEARLYEEKIHHYADQMIAIDLDDGVKVNYAKFQDVLGKIK